MSRSSGSSDSESESELVRLPPPVVKSPPKAAGSSSTSSSTSEETAPMSKAKSKKEVESSAQTAKRSRDDEQQANGGEKKKKKQAEAEAVIEEQSNGGLNKKQQKKKQLQQQEQNESAAKDEQGAKKKKTKKNADEAAANSEQETASKRAREEDKTEEPKGKKQKTTATPEPEAGKKKAKKAAAAASAAAQENGKADGENGNKVMVKVKTEEGASSEPRQQPRKWTLKDQIALIQQLVADSNAGMDVVKTKMDGYWTGFTERFNEKLEIPFSRLQVFDKVKRLRAKFDKDEKNPPSSKKKSPEEWELQGLMKQVWGSKENGCVTPSKNHDASDEDETSDEVQTVLTPVARKLNLKSPKSVGVKNADKSLVDMARQFMSAAQNQDPVLNSASVCTSLSSILYSYMAPEEKRRHLQDRLAENANLKKKLQCFLDCCASEEERIKKELASL